MTRLTSFLYLLVTGALLGSALYLAADDIPAPWEKTVRAAIDFGSGAVKIQAAVVNDNQITGKPLLATYTPLNITEDMAAHGGRISDQVAERALTILSDFKRQAIEAADGRPVAFRGIATAAFRRAENGDEWLRKFEELLGIHFQILAQTEEGQLGFLTARALYPGVPGGQLLAWDSGNGSFQMTTKPALETYRVYEGPLGHGTVRRILAEEVRGGSPLHAHQSGNPISREEALELAAQIVQSLPDVPDWLSDQLASPKTVVATFGDGESIFALAAQGIASLNEIAGQVEQAEITLQDVEHVIASFIGAEDSQLEAEGLHPKTVSSAIHLAAMMRHFGMESIHYSRSIGSTPGMLITPQGWSQPLSMHHS